MSPERICSAVVYIAEAITAGLYFKGPGNAFNYCLFFVVALFPAGELFCKRPALLCRKSCPDPFVLCNGENRRHSPRRIHDTHNDHNRSDRYGVIILHIRGFWSIYL